MDTYVSAGTRRVCALVRGIKVRFKELEGVFRQQQQEQQPPEPDGLQPPAAVEKGGIGEGSKEGSEKGSEGSGDEAGQGGDEEDVGPAGSSGRPPSIRQSRPPVPHTLEQLRAVVHGSRLQSFVAKQLRNILSEVFSSQGHRPEESSTSAQKSAGAALRVGARQGAAERSSAPFRPSCAVQAAVPAAFGAIVPPGTVAAPDRVAGRFRDLRGIASATATRRTYGFLFEWLYPQHMPTIAKCLEAWADDPRLTTPLLKFVAEFCFNKSQRLTFDSSSPNGILLFREVSKVVVTYANSIVPPGTVAAPGGVTAAVVGAGGAHGTGGGSALYDSRYKGTWVCLLALARAMSGNYVNFGVFDLYGDPALKDSLDAALRMVLAVPLSDLLAFRKLAKAYFALMEVLAAGHASVLAAQDTRTFVFLMSSMEMGLK
ncbi:Exportin-7-A [Tetrabaena socialis]|uniref:Exportin-7-A n=1 Tax=Tetrabaena socialis TaxID=47790 RepID=A0A2J8AD39_9CHLO|nr:Exportin-7-A [Tetrabaena socialis]|eukprot:PNH10428.1 Exportin-7-A [Tetrabaena socialis]